jgi:hypothetical protein
MESGHTPGTPEAPCVGGAPGLGAAPGDVGRRLETGQGRGFRVGEENPKEPP